MSASQDIVPIGVGALPVRLYTAPRDEGTRGHDRRAADVQSREMELFVLEWVTCAAVERISISTCTKKQ